MKTTHLRTVVFSDGGMGRGTSFGYSAAIAQQAAKSNSGAPWLGALLLAQMVARTTRVSS